jgi:CBS domain-containing protein
LAGWGYDAAFLRFALERESVGRAVVEVVLGYVLGVASVLLILLVVRARRTASLPELSAVVQVGRESKRDRRIAELAEVVTELGEEIAQLTFDPAAPEVRPESLTDYRRALDSYGNARDTLDGRDLERVRQELTYARNALVRLDARAHGLLSGRQFSGDQELGEVVADGEFTGHIYDQQLGPRQPLCCLGEERLHDVGQLRRGRMKEAELEPCDFGGEGVLVPQPFQLLSRKAAAGRGEV